ncbi:MAG: hypothetical protein KF767_15015 [Bdellovibrionaceae bacterium]|nr:hypothetical protein [Pseudobdellovibrionaceae bacterium]
MKAQTFSETRGRGSFDQEELVGRNALAALTAILFLQTGCAILHHVQIGQIDSRDGNAAWIPFEVMVSETGVNTEEIGRFAKAANNGQNNAVSDAAAIVSLFQIGPRTGNLVYNQTYAEKVIYLIHEKCPSGRVTGLMSVREMRKYPAISGEIVKVTGYCLRTRKAGKGSDT